MSWIYNDTERILKLAEEHRKYLRKLAFEANERMRAQRNGYKEHVRPNRETKVSS